MDDKKSELFSLIHGRYKSAQRIRLYENYCENLINRGLPPILSFHHLADTLEIPVQTLHCMAFKTNLFYKQFTIPKRSGGKRQIISPHPSLDSVQRWIGINILAPGFPETSSHVVGYIKGKSILDHVSPHLESESLVKFDIKDFFPSINSDDVYRMFSECGYIHSVAKTLAALMTFENRLPQGAATSPAISNIYMRSFDAALAEYCVENKYIFTRYADDIVVSGSERLGKSLSKIKHIFKQHSLPLNHSKTRLYKSKKQVRFVTGLILENSVMRLPKAMRRRIRVQCHLLVSNLDRLISGSSMLVSKPSPESWRDKEFVLDPIFPERLLGKLNYWLHVEPDNQYALEMKLLIQRKLSTI